jgi:XTP/dITP diphosphohydrolase
MIRVRIASSNPGKLREFAVAANQFGIEVSPMPRFAELAGVLENGETFEANARKKAEHYSRFAPGDLVLADDSGLAVDALKGAPGVLSARYAAAAEGNSSDEANNARLLQELSSVPDEQRTARFVCVIAAARDGRTVAEFRGEAAGRILRAPRGSNGFGYDPLFYFPPLGKTMAELAPEEKTRVSHRGKAFAKFLQWYAEGLPRRIT